MLNKICKSANTSKATILPATNFIYSLLKNEGFHNKYSSINVPAIINILNNNLPSMHGI